jgi:hypothetical protein
LERLIVTKINNPFDPYHSREVKEFECGLTIKEYIDLADPAAIGYEYAISLNGRLIDESVDITTVRAAGSLVFCAIPQGGGGGGKNVWRTVAQLAVVVIAAVATWYVGGAGGWAAGAGFTAGEAAALGAAAGLAVSVVGNLLINALLPLQTPDMASSGQSSTYGWEAGTNANREGVSWPVVYGTCRVVPPIIAKYIEVVDDKQYLHILYALADHQITSIDETSVRINENAVAKNVDGIDWEYRLGTVDQAILQYFGDTRTSYNVSQKVQINSIWTDTATYSANDLVSYFADLGSIAWGTVYKSLQSGNIDHRPGEEGSESWWTEEENGQPWTTFASTSEGSQGLAVAISFPKGLYCVDTTAGTVGQAGVELDIEYKKTGTSTWYRLQGKGSSGLFTEDRWSAGYIDPNYGTWTEVCAGSTDPDDHDEGEVYYPTSADGGWIYYWNPGDESSTFGRPDMHWTWRTDAPEKYQTGSVAVDHVELLDSKSSPLRRVFYRDNFPEAEYGAYDVRIRFHGSQVPSQSVNVGCDVWFDYVETIIYDDFIYPGTALFALRALATDKYSGGLPGISLVITRENVPVWYDGAYVNKPANNPAWASYDILHDSRYGGGVPHEKLDPSYADFDAWASFNITKSFTCNIFFDATVTLRKALDTIGLLGRGNTVQMGSNFTCFVDKPVTIPAQIFNVANMGAKSFAVEYMEMDSRANAVEVTYWDSENKDYKQKVLEIHAVDFDSTTQEIKKTQLSLIGCTSRDQALKLGNYAMNVNRLLTTTASWLADIDAIGCLPWDVVEAQHDVTYWGDGGRTVSATSNTITTDKTVDLETGKEYTLKVTCAATGEIETYTLATIGENITTSILTISGTFDPVPSKYDLWVLTVDGRETKQVRIVRISRQDDLTRKISAIEYNEDIYIDDGTLEPPEPPGAIIFTKNLKAEEIFSPVNSGESRIQLSWMGFAVLWYVFVKKEYDINWSYLGSTESPFYSITSLDYGVEYTFAVSHTRNPEEDGQTVTIIPVGGPGTGIIDTPLNFDVSLVDDKIVLSWDSTDGTSPTSFNINLEYESEEAVKVVENFIGNQYTYQEPLAAGVYSFFLTRTTTDGETPSLASDSVEIFVPSTPSIRQSNNGEVVTLQWQDCKTSLPIAYYTVNGYKVYSTMYVEAVNWEEKAFSVIAVDVAGNTSATGSATVTLGSEPPPEEVGAVTGITTQGYAYAIQLSLSYHTWDLFQAVEIWASADNVHANAVWVGETTGTTFVHKPLNLSTTRYYWTKIRDITGAYGAWYPLTNQSGVRGDVSSDPGAYLPDTPVDETGLSATLRRRIAWIDQGGFTFGSSYIEPGVVTGMNGVFETLASVQTSHDGRIGSAEVLIGQGMDGEWLSISSKATMETVDAIDGRLITAESEIQHGVMAEWSWISLKASVDYVDGEIVIAKAYAEEYYIAQGESRLAEIGQNIAVLVRQGGATDGFNRITAIENRLTCYDTLDAAVWVTSHLYYPGEIVYYGDGEDRHFYRCELEHTSSTPPPNGNWSEITEGQLAQWTLKMNVNGHICGVGMAINDEVSEFVIMADIFKIQHPDHPGEPAYTLPIFEVGYINGIGGQVGIRGNLVIDGTVLADAIDSGKIKSKDIELYCSDADVCIRAGKGYFGDTTEGFILGRDYNGSTNPARFEIGDSTRYLRWTSADGLEIAGKVTAESIQSGTFTGKILTIVKSTNAPCGLRTRYNSVDMDYDPSYGPGIVLGFHWTDSYPEFLMGDSTNYLWYQGGGANAGLRIHMEDTGHFHVGNETHYIDFSGGTLQLVGDMIVEGNIAAYNITAGLIGPGAVIATKLPNVTAGGGQSIIDDEYKAFNSVSPSYVEKCRITVRRQGGVRVKLSISNDAGVDGESYAKIYKNGVYTGYSFSTNNNNPDTFSQDFTGVAIDDYFSLYCAVDEFLNTGHVHSFIVSFNDPNVGSVTDL